MLAGVEMACSTLRPQNGRLLEGLAYLQELVRGITKVARSRHLQQLGGTAELHHVVFVDLRRHVVAEIGHQAEHRLSSGEVRQFHTGPANRDHRVGKDSSVAYTGTVEE